ncbi:mastermind-like domain-containing protein 1 [Microtus oregoni]|uniref:mastermind-like domain-containing protein 1 n=1 Tax=Microtus oregoni TaxID=111838 RepID=UPI001BB124B2|nr:mastermind-like domain-containing protein 1 [Microtus oregoni]
MDDWKSRLILESMLPHFNMAGNRQESRRLQESGTSKRRQEGDNFHFTGMADGGYPNKIKRPCLEDVTLSMGPGAHPTLSTELQMPTLTMNPSSADLGVAGQSLLLENNPLDNNAVNSSAMGSPFGVPSTTDTGLKGHAIPYYEKNNNMPAVDQELQDLLEELTKIQEPSSNDLDLEKILGNKTEEPVVEHHSQAPLGPPAKLPIQMPLMEILGPSKEYASSCSQATDTSLPVLPSSTEINYPIPPTSKQITSPSSSTTQAQVKNQAQTMLPVTLPPLSVPQWHHANQLKALAASKQGSATKHHGSNRSWSNLPTPGLSPPYLRVPSPHPPPTQPPPPPPFSPQNFTAPCMSSNSLSGSAAQSSSNALLSSMAPSSNAALGPTLSYAPAKLPALPHNQKPQFSPQSSILANLVSSSVKSPQGHLLSAVPTSTPGPSPPYRPENLSSPGLPQQSFTPQYSLIKSLTPTSSLLSQQQQQQQQQQHQLQHQQQQQQQANSIFKPMTSSQQSKTLSMIMQQGLASSSPEGPEPFIFSNTKPLSHFVSEPSLQKMASMPASSRQSSLFYYLPQATPAHVPSATASSTATATLQLQQLQQQHQQQPDQSSFLLQQTMQQPQPFQRMVASDSMPALPGQGCCHRCAWTTAALWLEHQHQQWNALNSTHGHAPPSNLTHVDKACKLGEARPPQVSLGRQPPSRQALGSESFLPGSSFAHELALVTSSFGTSEAAPWGSWDPKAWRQVPAPLLPSCDAAGLGQDPLNSLGSVCPKAKAMPPEVPLPKFCVNHLGSQSFTSHQLSFPSVPMMSLVFSNAVWAVAAAAVATPVSKKSPLSQVDICMLQSFPSQRAVVQANQIAPGVRPGQKVPAALVGPRFSLLGNQSFVQSPAQGPVPVLSTTPLQQSMASCSPLSPVQGLEPPSYVAAIAATSQSPGTLMRASTSPEPQDNVLPQAQSPTNGLISPSSAGSEVNFVEELLEGSSVAPDEDWVCNLRLIDDILQQRAAAPNATAQNAEQVTQGAEEL